MKNQIVFLFCFIAFIFNIQAFPGDQDPLSCQLAFGSLKDASGNYTGAERQNVLDKGSTNGIYKYGGAYQQQNYPNLDEQTYKDTIKALASKEFTEAIRGNHDLNYSYTKLGDSLSDFVDFYGVILPEKIGWSKASGAYRGNLIFMDSWDDYYSAGAGIIDPGATFYGRNYAKAGDTTLATLNLLGISRSIDRENLDIISTGTGTRNFCVQTRIAETTFIINPVEEIPTPKSSLRSSLMIGGNDIFESGAGIGSWMPFLNKHQVDLSLSNISLIVDWHLENGKKIFLEGTIPVFSATNEYKAKIRAYHNPSKRVTKLGDSLSDFVDFYGVNV
jgi:hypothetical protein